MRSVKKRERHTRYIKAMKQLFFVHGGDSLESGEDFFEAWNSDTTWKLENPFEKKEKKKWKDDVVESLGEEWACAFPRFPNDMDAHYEQWKWWFEKHLPFMKENIVLVGHSLGGVFLAKYLSENTLPIQVAQLHLIAPTTGEGDFVLPDSLENIEKQVKNIHIYHSEDDTVVPISHGEMYAGKLPNAEFLRFTDRGHFFAYPEFPELVERIKNAR